MSDFILKKGKKYQFYTDQEIDEYIKDIKGGWEILDG